MLGNIGPVSLIFIVLIVLLLFGPNKLPELGRAVGKTLREFKNGAKEMMDDEEDKTNKSTARKEVNETEPKDKDNRRLPE